MNNALQQAIAAIKAGDKKSGYRLLADVIKADPRGRDAEMAWLWMTAVVATPQKKRQCLETVLLLNPQNEMAQKGLAQLSVSEPANPPATAWEHQLSSVQTQSASPAAPAASLVYCPTCHLPFKTSRDLTRHIANWHMKEIETQTRGETAVVIHPAHPLASPLADEAPSPKSALLVKAGIAILLIAVIAGVILLFPEILAFLQPFLEMAIFAFFFPLTFPVMMIIIGGISSIVAPFLTWMVNVGLYLLTQGWWWFPGGWITGAIAAFFIWSGSW